MIRLPVTARSFAAPALGALGLALAACSGSEAPPPADTNEVEAPVVENMGFENMVEPVAPPTATPTSEATPEAPAPADEQVQADADAVGMTARVDRSAPADTEADTEVPVEQKK